MSYADLFKDLDSSKTRAPQGARWVAELSEEQNKALNAPFKESAVICAGAGAGKTKLLTERVCALIKAGINPSKIAVVTFTRKSAHEITERVKAKLGARSNMPFCGTVHALALSVATKQGREFQLATPEQELACVKELSAILPDDFSDFTDKELLLMVNRAREQGDYESNEGLIASAYEELLEQNNLQDFTSLLLIASEKSANLFDYVLVDEAQDLSQLQLTFLRQIAMSAFYWFIGDSDQAIYSFRGAVPSMMHQLRGETQGFYILSTNYRSSTSVVTHANNVIGFNSGRFEIEWQAHRKDAGSVSVMNFESGEEELAHVKKWLTESPSTRCALARTQALVAALKAEGLPACSVHESKGLEWDEVHVMGCEAALFPHPLAVRDEERRLFYVAMTRAKTNLVMSYCSTRAAKNPNLVIRNPSPFLFETQALQDKS